MNVKLLTNFASLSGAEAISKVLTFLAFAYIARVFGSAGYGYIEWAGAILMCASLIVDQGFSSYGAREIAKAPSRTAELVSQIVTARLLLAGLAFAATTLFAVFYVTDPALRSLVLIFGLSLWLLPFLLQWAFQGHDRMHLVSITQIVRQSTFAAIVFLLVDGPSNLFVVGVAEVAAVGCGAALSLVLYRKAIHTTSSLRPALSWDTFRSGGTIGLSQLFWVVKMFGATVVVGMIASAAETGVFAAAMRIFIAIHTFVWLYFANLLPSLSRAWTNDHPAFSDLIRNSLRLVVSVAVPATVIGFFVAPYLMTFAFGAEFADGAGALRWLGVACLFTAISGHFRFGLIAAGFQSREMLASAIGAVTAVAGIVAGYIYGGITFAALGLCIAEGVILLVTWLQKKQVLDKVSRAIQQPADERVIAGLPQSAR